MPSERTELSVQSFFPAETPPSVDVRHVVRNKLSLWVDVRDEQAGMSQKIFEVGALK